MYLNRLEAGARNDTWRILIIDDDEDDFIIVRDMLKAAKGRKFEVDWASTYHAGRESLLRHEYHAVLVDYDLGIHTGVELIREINERGYTSPLILFTGRGSYEVDVEAMQAGATLYLTKGETSALMLERSIRYAIEHKQIEQALQENTALLEKRNAALRKSEEKYSKTFRASPIAIAISTVADGRFVEVNDSYTELYGFRREELIGHTSIELGMFPDPAVRQDIIQKFRANGGFRNYELRLLTKTGSPKDVLFSTEAVEIDGQECMLSLVIDISERKQAERTMVLFNEQLQEQAEELEVQTEELRIQTEELTEVNGKLNVQARLLAHVQEAIVGADESWRITYWNKGAETMFGWSEKEALGKWMHELLRSRFPHPTRAQAMAQLEEFCHIENEVVYQRKDGADITTHTQITVVLDHHGKPGGFVSSMRDITDRKQAEKEIYQLNADLECRVTERTAQLEAVNRELETFAYSVSHDLRAPLRRIDGYCYLLSQDGLSQENEENQSTITHIRQQVSRMNTLIDDLLNLSRVSRMEINHQEVNLSNLAQSIATQLMETISNRQVDWKIQPNLVVQGDARLLEIVITNLLNNAVKFTGKKENAQIEFGICEKKGKSAYYVRDNGAGFDMAYAGKLFGPFQRLHAMTEFPGTGIGLAIVSQIIRRHGGQIWAEAQPELGASFFFTLGR